MGLEPGDYLTDRVHLFRLEVFLPKGEGLLLEDAWTGRVWFVSLPEFKLMKLRKVLREPG